MAVNDGNTFYWFGLVCFSAGLTMMVAGLGTKYWMVDENGPGSAGLFWVCAARDRCIPVTANDREGVVQGLEITATVVAALSTFMAIFYLLWFHRISYKTITMPNLIWILSSAAGLFGIIGIGIYAVNIFISTKVRLEHISTIQIGYSFALCLTGSILLLFSGGFVRGGACKMIKEAEAAATRGINALDPLSRIVSISGNHNLGFEFDPVNAPPLYSAVCSGAYCDPKFLPAPPGYEELFPGAEPPPPYVLQWEASHSLSNLVEGKSQEQVQSATVYTSETNDNQQSTSSS